MVEKAKPAKATRRKHEDRSANFVLRVSHPRLISRFVVREEVAHRSSAFECGDNEGQRRNFKSCTKFGVESAQPNAERALAGADCGGASENCPSQCLTHSQASVAASATPRKATQQRCAGSFSEAGDTCSPATHRLVALRNSIKGYGPSPRFRSRLRQLNRSHRHRGNPFPASDKSQPFIRRRLHTNPLRRDADSVGQVGFHFVKMWRNLRSFGNE